MKEKDLLQELQQISRRTGASGIGDDAAVVQNLVISTDQFVEGIHFRWDWQSPREVGYKGVVQALSDLAAMATLPSGLLLSAALPVGTEIFSTEIFAGVEDACHDYSVPLLGGDLTRSPSHTYLDFVALGFSSSPVKKSGARPGDLLAVTGPLGSAHGGLLCFKNGWTSPALQQAFLRPQAHIKTAHRLHQVHALTALTDLSDSLGKSVLELSAHSQCGFEIDFEKIPVSKDLVRLSQEKNQDLFQMVTTGGEDYQLLMTLPPHTSEKLISDHGLVVIGRAVPTASNTYVHNGKKTQVTEVGWDPFGL